jgi:hypothetical protein
MQGAQGEEQQADLVVTSWGRQASSRGLPFDRPEVWCRRAPSLLRSQALKKCSSAMPDGRLSQRSPILSSTGISTCCVSRSMG